MSARASVLFVCVHNAGRSQMAAGFLRELGGDRVEVRSAGSIPAAHINPVAVEAMAEVGIPPIAPAGMQNMAPRARRAIFPSRIRSRPL